MSLRPSHPSRSSPPTSCRAGRRPGMGLLVAVVALGLLGLARPAAAEDSASCEFLEIHAASSASPAVPPELKRLEKKLKKPPFSSWNTFRLLTQNARTLGRLRSEQVKLSNGAATILFRDVQRSGSKKARLALSVTLDDQTGKRVLDTKVAVDSGDFVLFGRSLPSNEGHVLAISCKL
ncbi:MAG: hypothetical protein KA297_06625 [Kofleriaceae bacterium]|nr:hypothetical protein [Kofleriaceae bacterium]